MWNVLQCSSLELSIHCFPCDIRMLEHWKGSIIRGQKITRVERDWLDSIWIPQGANNIPSLLFIKSAFFLTDLVRRVTTEHASREQRRRADLWCAGDGVTSDICSHVCCPGKAKPGRTCHQQLQATARSQQRRPLNSLPQQGSWKELLGFCGPRFWLISHRAEVNL